MIILEKKMIRRIHRATMKRNKRSSARFKSVTPQKSEVQINF